MIFFNDIPYAIESFWIFPFHQLPCRGNDKATKMKQFKISDLFIFGKNKIWNDGEKDVMTMIEFNKKTCSGMV